MWISIKNLCYDLKILQWDCERQSIRVEGMGADPRRFDVIMAKEFVGR